MSHYRTVRERTKALWVGRSVTRELQALTFDGHVPGAESGQKEWIVADFGGLDPEELYNHARAIGEWAGRLELHSLKLMNDAAQLAFPDLAD